MKFRLLYITNMWQS